MRSLPKIFWRLIWLPPLLLAFGQNCAPFKPMELASTVSAGNVATSTPAPLDPNSFTAGFACVQPKAVSQELRRLHKTEYVNILNDFFPNEFRASEFQLELALMPDDKITG